MTARHTKLVSQSGADPRIKNKTGWTALHCCALISDPGFQRAVPPPLPAHALLCVFDAISSA